jgi:hypothetical protein
MAFAAAGRWQQRALAYAESYAVHVHRDWEAFRKAKVKV